MMNHLIKKTNIFRFLKFIPATAYVFTACTKINNTHNVTTGEIGSLMTYRKERIQKIESAVAKNPDAWEKIKLEEITPLLEGGLLYDIALIDLLTEDELTINARNGSLAKLIDTNRQGLKFFEKPAEGGNQAVYILKDKNEKKYVLKVLKEPRLKEEILAGRFYRALGVDVPANRASRISVDELHEKVKDLQGLEAIEGLSGDQKILVSLSEFIEGKLLREELNFECLQHVKDINQLGEREREIIKEINRGFVADCFLANWDITKDLKNIIVRDGKVYRFDNGGALRYRALGKVKKENELEEVQEFVSMRDRKMNPYGNFLYKFVTDEEILAQIKEIIAKKEALLKAYDDLELEIGDDLDKREVEGIRKALLGKEKPLSEEEKENLVNRHDELEKKIKQNQKDDRKLKSLLVQRLRSIAAYARGTFLPKSIVEEPCYVRTDAYGIATKNSAAGMLNYTKIGERTYVLLGKRIKHDYWGNLGGGSEINKEKTLAETASREVLEESLGMFNFRPDQLIKYPSHDLVSKERESDLRHSNDDSVKLFRMYLVPSEYVSPQNLNEKLKQEEKACKREYSDFMWVELASLLGAVRDCNNSSKFDELPKEKNGVCLKKIRIDDRKDDSFELHWPLYCMLRQAPMLKMLAKVADGEDFDPIHTAGSISLLKNVEIEYKEEIDLEKLNFPENPYMIENQLAGQVVNSGFVIADLKKLKNGESVELNKSVVNRHKSILEKNRKEPIFAKIKKPELVTESLRKANIKEFPKENISETTATEAMLRSFIKDPQAIVSVESLRTLFDGEKFAIKTFNSKSSEFNRFLETLVNVHEEEQRHKDKFVFYHACEPFIGFYIDVINEIRNQIAQESSDNIRLLRAFDDNFEHENVLEMLLSEFNLQKIKDFQKIDNYKGEFQSKNLAVNISLLGSPGRKTSSTAKLFYEGKSVKAPDSYKLLVNLLSNLVKDNSIENYNSLFEKYLSKNSRLLQIFVNKDCVNELAYICESKGSIPYSSDASNIEQLLKSNSVSIVLDSLREASGDFDTIFKNLNVELKMVQARLYLKPEFFWDKDKVLIKSYLIDSLKQDYKEEIRELTKHVMSLWLQGSYMLNEGKIFNNKVLLQNSYQKAYESVHGDCTYKQHLINNMEPNDSMSDFIKKSKEFLQKYKDLEKKASDFFSALGSDKELLKKYKESEDKIFKGITQIELDQKLYRNRNFSAIKLCAEAYKIETCIISLKGIPENSNDCSYKFIKLLHEYYLETEKIREKIYGGGLK